MIKEHYSPKLLISYVNPMKINFSREELQFIRDNCFFNLKIEQITETTVAPIYDEIVNLIEFYKSIGAHSLVQYASGIADKLFEYVPWEEVEKEAELAEQIKAEAQNYVPETHY